MRPRRGTSRGPACTTRARGDGRRLECCVACASLQLAPLPEAGADEVRDTAQKVVGREHGDGGCGGVRLECEGGTDGIVGFLRPVEERGVDELGDVVEEVGSVRQEREQLVRRQAVRKRTRRRMGRMWMSSSCRPSSSSAAFPERSSTSTGPLPRYFTSCAPVRCSPMRSDCTRVRSSFNTGMAASGKGDNPRRMSRMRGLLSP